MVVVINGVRLVLELRRTCRGITRKVMVVNGVRVVLELRRTCRGIARKGAQVPKSQGVRGSTQMSQGQHFL